MKAFAMIRKVAEDTDSDKGRAASRVLVLLEKDGTVDQIPATAINILALQSSEKAVPTLLAFLPYASTEAKETIREVLRPLAARMEGSGPILVKAMSDPIKERRIAAVEALASLTSFQTKAREALKDKDIGIRTAAALALADARDKEAVPVLINLLAEAPAEKAWEIESYLARIAGPSRPTASLGTSGSNAKTVSDEWMKWWNTNKATVSLVRSRGPRHFLGYTLVVEYYNSQTNRGRVLELDRNGKVRWEIGGMRYPYEAKILGHNRVMIAEQNLNRLTIRDFKGKVIKNITVNQPCVCQKLKNGRIFVAGRYEFVIADQKGNRISQQRVSDYVMHARRMKNGEFVYVNSSYYYRRVDDKGRVKKSFQLPRSNLGGSRYAEVLPNGNVLLTMYSEKRVLEIDPNGKTVWEAKNIPQPYVATRLKNGNTLISCRNLRKVVEVNRAGKIVKEITKNNFYPYKAYKR